MIVIFCLNIYFCRLFEVLIKKIDINNDDFIFSIYIFNVETSMKIILLHFQAKLQTHYSNIVVPSVNKIA